MNYDLGCCIECYTKGKNNPNDISHTNTCCVCAEYFLTNIECKIFKIALQHCCKIGEYVKCTGCTKNRKIMFNVPMCKECIGPFDTEVVTSDETSSSDEVVPKRKNLVHYDETSSSEETSE